MHFVSKCRKASTSTHIHTPGNTPAHQRVCVKSPDGPQVESCSRERARSAESDRLWLINHGSISNIRSLRSYSQRYKITHKLFRTQNWFRQSCSFLSSCWDFYIWLFLSHRVFCLRSSWKSTRVCDPGTEMSGRCVKRKWKHGRVGQFWHLQMQV